MKTIKKYKIKVVDTLFMHTVCGARTYTHFLISMLPRNYCTNILSMILFRQRKIE